MYNTVLLPSQAVLRQLSIRRKPTALFFKRALLISRYNALPKCQIPPKECANARHQITLKPQRRIALLTAPAAYPEESSAEDPTTCNDVRFRPCTKNTGLEEGWDTVPDNLDILREACAPLYRVRRDENVLPFHRLARGGDLEECQ